ncbi:hypothetical protein ACET3Z_031331 [Daucus carota]
MSGCRSRKLQKGYAHGSPLLESSIAFDLREGAAKIAAALGRILLLDLVIRNEDKLPCQQLSWRGNFANLLLADKIASVYVDEMNEPFESVINKYRPTIIKALQIELRTTSVDGSLSTHNAVSPVDPLRENVLMIGQSIRSWWSFLSTVLDTQHKFSMRGKASSSGSPKFRDGVPGRFNKGNSESLRNMHFTSKLRDFHKLLIKDDVELNKGIEQWDEMLKVEAVKLCQENIFSTGFFESGESSNVIDAYELKVRLEHILERIALTSDAANTKKPSLISSTLFIGGALAARSQYTQQHLGITHFVLVL